MKMYLDHNFYKTFMPNEILEQKNEPLDPELFEKDSHQISLKSTIVPTIHSFLEPQ